MGLSASAIAIRLTFLLTGAILPIYGQVVSAAKRPYSRHQRPRLSSAYLQAGELHTEADGSNIVIRCQSAFGEHRAGPKRQERGGMRTSQNGRLGSRTQSNCYAGFAFAPPFKRRDQKKRVTLLSWNSPSDHLASRARILGDFDFL